MSLINPGRSLFGWPVLSFPLGIIWSTTRVLYSIVYTVVNWHNHLRIRAIFKLCVYLVPRLLTGMTLTASIHSLINT